MRFAAGILGGLRSGKTTAPRPNEAAQFGAGAAFAGACADQIALHIRQPAKHGTIMSPPAPLDVSAQVRQGLRITRPRR